MHLQGIRKACTPGQEATASRELKPQEWKIEAEEIQKPLGTTLPFLSLLLPTPPPNSTTLRKSTKTRATCFFSNKRLGLPPRATSGYLGLPRATSGYLGILRANVHLL